MSTTHKVPLGQQIAACRHIQRSFEGRSKMLDQMRTTADKGYVVEGLAGAIRTLEWLYANQAAIQAAMNAVVAARAAVAKKDGGQ